MGLLILLGSFWGYLALVPLVIGIVGLRQGRKTGWVSIAGAVLLYGLYLYAINAGATTSSDFQQSTAVQNLSKTNSLLKPTRPLDGKTEAKIEGAVVQSHVGSDSVEIIRYTADNTGLSVWIHGRVSVLPTNCGKLYELEYSDDPCVPAGKTPGGHALYRRAEFEHFTYVADFGTAWVVVPDTTSNVTQISEYLDGMQPVSSLPSAKFQLFPRAVQ